MEALPPSPQLFSRQGSRTEQDDVSAALLSEEIIPLFHHAVLH
jgi:hypothetical protein